ncbi:MAG TPA: glycosyltransferase N-terminal domain-containing protein [Gemmatimonadales bacterium]|jgi:3-deoxy-D-manno-octulosonic-acid transferase
MTETSWGYRILVQAAAALVPALGLFDPKVRSGHRRRQGAAMRLRRWAVTGRDVARPLVWFHASSVGEGLQAQSVMAEFRRLRPEAQWVYTHFSPSAERFASHLPVDVADYLPYDSPGAAETLLDSLAPDLLVFSKLDLWPELATRAAGRGTAVVMIAATVSPGSGRLRWPARPLLRPGYRAVSAAGAISPEDGERLALLGVPADRIQVLGDPRFDSVMQRVESVRPDDPLLRWGNGAATLVAGSTWPEDEAVILQAFAILQRRRLRARLLLVPHEPTPAHLVAVERAAVRAGLMRPVRLSSANVGAPLVLVDRVGVLATLYGAGSMAYVGGGFGRAGLHSVLEPAAWGVPVVFGPRWQNSRDAGLLLQTGAAEALEELHRRKAAESLAQIWEGWLASDARRSIQGRRARQVVEGGLGGARRSAELLQELISSRLLQRSPTSAQ